MSSMYSNSFQDFSLTPMASEDHDSMTDDDDIDDAPVIEIEKVTGGSSVPSQDALLVEEGLHKTAYVEKL
ncbi:hypothetical protein LIER_42114 [Lithospermum erythrorhizon]|uniref:Uncharacterized protein n=1 Tax=Lithospermum erythrorhizon TaxID=34254 RepID=A0AAV3RLI7_LITER